MIIDLECLDLPSETVRACGIDLGTTNSTIAEACWDPSEPNEIRVQCLSIDQIIHDESYSSPIVPSVIAIHDDTVFIGEGAKRMRSASNEQGLLRGRNLFFDCKNDIGTSRIYHRAPDGYQSASDIGSMIIKFLKDAVSKTFGTNRYLTAVTVPSSFQLSQRNDTAEAAKMAGLDVSSHMLLDEPIASFLECVNSYGLSSFDLNEREKNLLVFDFGGGTCDVSIIALKKPIGERALNVMPLAVSRYHRLGGGDIDAAIFYEVLLPQLIEQNDLDKIELGFSSKKQILEPSYIGIAEDLKIRLCDQISHLIKNGKYNSADKDSIIITHPGVHTVTVAGRIMNLTSPKLSASQLEAILEPFMDIDMLHARSTEYRMTCSIFAPVEDAIDRSNLNYGDIDYVLLTGGSSLIPQIVSKIESFLPSSEIISFTDENARRTATAKGAAIHALSVALTGHGLIQPVAHDTISIKTKSGEVELVSKGMKLPFSKKDGKSLKFKTPIGSATKYIELRVEVFGGTGIHKRFLLSEIWKLNPPTSKGEILNLAYGYDANQVLSLKFSRMDAGKAIPFEKEIENPSTNVMNINQIELEIDLLESDIFRGKIPQGLHLEKYTELADKYSEIGYYEKSIEIAKRLLRKFGSVGNNLLDDIATCYDYLNDHERAERFYREAAESDKNSSDPWFNYALYLRDRRSYSEALSIIHKAIHLEDRPPYRILEACIMEAMEKTDERDELLFVHMPRFGGLRSLSEWELGWYLTGCNLNGDETRKDQIKSEQKRRKITGDTQSKRGLLPEEISEV